LASGMIKLRYPEGKGIERQGALGEGPPAAEHKSLESTTG